MTGRLTVRCILALVALLLGPLRAEAQPQPGAPLAWQIEAVVGIARVSPDDVNARVEYDTTWLDYLRTAQVTQQHEGELEG